MLELAQDVDERERKGAKLERRTRRDWAGRGSARRDSHCWNSRKTWMNADARAQNSDGESNVIGWVRGAQDSAAATSDANGDLE